MMQILYLSLRLVTNNRLTKLVIYCSFMCLTFVSIFSVFAVAGNNLQSVLFDESLVTYSDGNDEIGTFSISICSSDTDCFEVEASSIGVIGGVQCRTVVSARLSNIGLTLEQDHLEYVKVCKRDSTV